MIELFIGGLLASVFYLGVAASNDRLAKELRPTTQPDWLVFWSSIAFYSVLAQTWAFDIVSLAVVVAAILYSALVTVNDLRDWLIPDGLNIVSVISLMLLTIPHSVANDDLDRLLSAVITFAVAAALMVFLVVVSRGRLGGGDIRLVAVLAFAMGWVIQPQPVQALLLTVLVLIGASFIKLAYAYVVYRIRLKNPSFLPDPDPPPIEGLNESFAKTTVPAGPSFCIAAMLLLSLTN